MPLAILLAASVPAGERGKVVFERVCGTCHPSDVVSEMRNSREGWRDLVNEMFLRGGSATAREKTAVVDYLAKKYPPSPERKVDRK